MVELTLLELTGVGVPPYSARGLTQSLQPIAQAVSVGRTVNGTLINMSATQMQKYSSVISGIDQESPVMVWPGTLVTVDCIAELAVEGESESVTESDSDSEAQIFDRPHVPGSIHYGDGFTFYRPRLDMMVVGLTISRDEWGAAVTWSLSLEEV